MCVCIFVFFSAKALPVVLADGGSNESQPAATPERVVAIPAMPHTRTTCSNIDLKKRISLQPQFIIDCGQYMYIYMFIYIKGKKEEKKKNKAEGLGMSPSTETAIVDTWGFTTFLGVCSALLSDTDNICRSPEEKLVQLVDPKGLAVHGLCHRVRGLS